MSLVKRVEKLEKDIFPGCDLDIPFEQLSDKALEAIAPGPVCEHFQALSDAELQAVIDGGPAPCTCNRGAMPTLPDWVLTEIAELQSDPSLNYSKTTGVA